MKKIIINSIICILFTGVIIALVSVNKEQIHSGIHGGKVKSVGEYYIETKVLPDCVYAYLLIEEDKPISNINSSCEITFYFNNKKSINLHLKPFRDDGFFAPGEELLGYTAFNIQFILNGKSISTTFENDNAEIIVHH